MKSQDEWLSQSPGVQTAHDPSRVPQVFKGTATWRDIRHYTLSPMPGLSEILVPTVSTPFSCEGRRLCLMPVTQQISIVPVLL